MIMNTAEISNPSIRVKPSPKLIQFISKVKVCVDLPAGISNIVFKNHVKKKITGKPRDIKCLITEEDKHFVQSCKVDFNVNHTHLPFHTTLVDSSNKLLNLQDLSWLYEYIRKENAKNNEKIYLHELLEGSEIILPKNQEIPRSEELDKRCQKLKRAQENKDYYQMTKNVDSTKRKLPEDSIGYQLRQMNKHMVAIFQFVLSVAAGFAFGFIGVELILGSLDFGFRLLLGIICALIIALAELYFLAKRLNEDLLFEYTIEKQHKNVKID